MRMAFVLVTLLLVNVVSANAASAKDGSLSASRQLMAPFALDSFSSFLEPASLDARQCHDAVAQGLDTLSRRLLSAKEDSQQATEIADPRTTKDCTHPIFLDPEKYGAVRSLPLGYWYSCMDVKGQDMEQVSTNDLMSQEERLMSYAEACSNNELCEGFNSAGWLKYGALRGKTYQKPDIDFYSKMPPLCPKDVHISTVYGYWRISCFDLSGGDLRRVRAKDWKKPVSIEDAKKHCDTDASCIGFNSAGWLKKAGYLSGLTFNVDMDTFLKPNPTVLEEIMQLQG